MTIEQPRRLPGPIADGKGTRDPERVEAMQVPPGRQNRRRAQEIAAGSGTNEPAVERMQNGRKLGIRSEMTIDRSELAHHGIRRLADSARRCFTADEPLDRGALGPLPVRRL